MQQILDYLRRNGEQVDFEIANAIRVPLSQVRTRLAELSANGEVTICRITRFQGPRKIEGWTCRIAGQLPVISPGRKPKGRAAQ